MKNARLVVACAAALALGLSMTATAKKVENQKG